MSIEDCPTGAAILSIRRHKGFWTIFVNDKPVISCTTFAAAWTAIWEVSHAC